MRFRAPEGQGAPVLRGTALAAGKGGIYQVTDPADIDTMRALGFIDADAPAAAPKPAADTRVRDAAVAALAAFGVTLADPTDELVAKALGELPKLLEDRVATALDASKADKTAGKSK